MLDIIRVIHSIVRWLVVLVGLWAVVRAWLGLFVGRNWNSWDRMAGQFFITALDFQLLLGVLLFFLNTEARSAVQDISISVPLASLGFSIFRHVGFTLLAAIIAHLGSRSTRKAATTRTRFARAALLFTLALVLLYFAIPWPW